jgi:hypothetical protein
MRSRLQDRVSRSLFAGVLALAVFVVGHNLYFLVRDGSGFGSDIARTGDGSSWNDTAWFVLAAAAFLAGLAIVRLAFLVREVLRSDLRQQVVRPSWSTYAHAVLPLWLKWFCASIPLFVLQENYERWSVGLALPGISVLGVAGPASPIFVFGLVSLLFALVVALFRLGIERLETMIAEARTRSWCGAPAVRRPGPTGEAVPASVIGRNLAGRAPPTLLPA